MKTLKIIRMELKYFHNEEHFQFMTDILQILEASFESKVGNLATNIESLFSSFKELHDREDAAVPYLRKSGFSSLIAKADEHRDMVYRGLVLSTESFLHSPDAAQREAAQHIKAVIHNYGNLRRKSYNEETATIHNLLQDLQERLSNQVETIGLGLWIEHLQHANESFQALMIKRYDEDPGRENARIVRSEIDSVYRQLVSLIEIEHRISGGTQYVHLIEKINELVSYNKTILAQRKGRADANNDEDIIEEWE